MKVGDIDPQTYWRMTDNWLEVTVRFLAPDHGVRPIKDQMSREILAGLERAQDRDCLRDLRDRSGCRRSGSKRRACY